MPERNSGTETVLTEGTRFDVRIMMIVIGGIVSVVGSWGQLQLQITRMDANLQARIVQVKTETERAAEEASREQSEKIQGMKSELSQVRATSCAIAKKLEVVTTGCGRNDRDE